MKIILLFLLMLMLPPLEAETQSLMTTTSLGSLRYIEPLVEFEEKKLDPPIPRQQWNYLTKVWLARSCVGEAGFDAIEECIGIAWTMATRTREHRTSFLRVVQSYSSAIKKHVDHRRPWIFQLDMKGDKPRDWPKKAASWKYHRGLWFKLLVELDKWAKGKRPNPVEGANHFGGEMDTPGIAWSVIEPSFGLKFKNLFYRCFTEQTATLTKP